MFAQANYVRVHAYYQHGNVRDDDHIFLVAGRQLGVEEEHLALLEGYGSIVVEF